MLLYSRRKRKGNERNQEEKGEQNALKKKRKKRQSLTLHLERNQFLLSSTSKTHLRYYCLRKKKLVSEGVAKEKQMKRKREKNKHEEKVKSKVTIGCSKMARSPHNFHKSKITLFPPLSLSPSLPWNVGRGISGQHVA